MRVLTGLGNVEAEVVAGRLRAAGMSASVVRDHDLTGVVGTSVFGTYSVLVPIDEAEGARALVDDSPSRHSRHVDQDSPFGVRAIMLIVFALVIAFGVLTYWSASH